MLIGYSTSPCDPPPGTTIQEFIPVPALLAHPHVLGAQRWVGIGDRIVANAQLIIDHKQQEQELKREREENERLRIQLRQYMDVSERLTNTEKQLAELRQENEELREQLRRMEAERDEYKHRLERGDCEREEEKRRRDRMYLAAELVFTLEDAICTEVFGDGYWKRNKSMTDIKFVDEESRQHESWEEQWLHLRDQLHVRQKFGCTYDFCVFLETMKRQRNKASHQVFRVKRSIQRLTADVLAYCADYEAEQVATIERMMDADEKEGARQEAAEERARYQRKSESMMQMLKQLVGDYPFGK